MSADRERVRDELILGCRAQLIEPPTPERVSEIARSALPQAEQALIAVRDDDEESLLGLIKGGPGNVSLETMLVEISAYLSLVPRSLTETLHPNSRRGA